MTEEVNVYDHPDEEGGPLSELPLEQRQQEYQQAVEAWKRLSPEERQRLEQLLKESGVDVAALGAEPKAEDGWPTG